MTTLPLMAAPASPIHSPASTRAVASKRKADQVTPQCPPDRGPTPPAPKGPAQSGPCRQLHPFTHRALATPAYLRAFARVVSSASNALPICPQKPPQLGPYSRQTPWHCALHPCSPCHGCHCTRVSWSL